ncbi:MAG: hypothetical protein K0S00_3418 [Xanthobacteraceae bacterium]|jgi:hypothetical protein|nr:hypothetical protein [Xanthobacteraceae bacterium]
MIPMRPVHLWESGSTKRTLADVEAAAWFLLNNWPVAHAGTDLHRTARSLALKTLSGKGSAAIFRVALVSAAKEADIYAEPADEPEDLLPRYVAEPWRHSGKKRQRR